eukprot:GFUD01019586.1.p1 GENE.GFUD01019586.1~~GFUD01019586.1.p1  ORF type:complete len:191 (-),score=60.89 GFUD01019586.1:182-754(-)
MSESGELTDGDSEMEQEPDSDASLVDSDQENGCNPTGLFDALAAAQEAGERYRMLEEGGIDESCRLSNDFFVQSFKDAIRHSWVEVPAASSESEHDTSWRVGDRCHAVFSEDGEFYRAKVILVKDWKSAAVVRFSDYGNEEEVKMADMTKIPPNPSKKRKKRPVKKKRKSRHRNKSGPIVTTAIESNYLV